MISLDDVITDFDDVPITVKLTHAHFERLIEKVGDISRVVFEQSLVVVEISLDKRDRLNGKRLAVITKLFERVIPRSVDSLLALLVHLVGSIAPNNVVNRIVRHIAVADDTITLRDDEAFEFGVSLSVRIHGVLLTNPPVEENPEPTERVGIARAENLRTHSDSVSGAREKELEKFERHLRQLVDADIRKLLTTIASVKLRVRHIVSGKFEFGGRLEVPRHIILGLVILAKVIKPTNALVDDILEVILVLTEYDAIEMLIVDVVERLREHSDRVVVDRVELSHIKMVSPRDSDTAAVALVLALANPQNFFCENARSVRSLGDVSVNVRLRLSPCVGIHKLVVRHKSHKLVPPRLFGVIVNQRHLDPSSERAHHVSNLINELLVFHFDVRMLVAHLSHDTTHTLNVSPSCGDRSRHVHRRNKRINLRSPCSNHFPLFISDPSHEHISRAAVVPLFISERPDRHGIISAASEPKTLVGEINSSVSTSHA